MTTAELEIIHTEIARLMEQTSRINQETMWYPMVIATGIVGAVATATAILIKFL